MATLWAAFGIATAFLFKDVPRAASVVQPDSEPELAVPMEPLFPSASKEDIMETNRPVEAQGDLPGLRNDPVFSPDNIGGYRPSASQWGVVATMCWFSMTCCKLRRVSPRSSALT